MSWDTPEGQESQQRPYMSSPRDSLGSAMILMTDTDSEIRKLELFLRGLQEVENKKIIIVGKHLCNDEGVSEVVGMAQSIANKIYQFGHHEREEINNILEFANDAMVKLLMVRKREFDIFDDAARSSIHYSFMVTIYGCLIRGKEGGERSFWKGTVLELRQQSINNAGKPTEGGGIFSRLFKR